MRANKELIEKCITLYNASNGELIFFNFVRARSFLSIKDNKLHVSITAYEWISQIFNYFSLVILGLGGAMLLLLPLYIKDTSTYQSLGLNLIGLGLLFITYLLLIQTLPIHAARRIKKYMIKHREILGEQEDQ